MHTTAEDNYPNDLEMLYEKAASERDHLRQINAQLIAALEETLKSLELHLDSDTAHNGLKHRDMLCPCNSTTVVSARAALTAAKGE